MARLRAITPTIALLATGLGSISAADTPARLVVGENSIEEELRLPALLKPGRYSIGCHTEITASGRSLHAACYEMPDSPPSHMTDAVLEATRRARFEPATRAGIAAPVVVSYGVLIDTTLGEPLVLAVPNDFAERDRFGLLYTSPQRLVKAGQQTGLPPWEVRPRSPLWLKMRIDEDGKVTGYVLDDAGRASTRGIDKVRSRIERMRFIPGYHEDRPVAMLYTEPSYSLELGDPW